MTEIMLTLEAAVDNLDADMRPLVKDLFMSTPNLAKDPKTTDLHKSVTLRQPAPATHFRSTSYNLSVVARKAIVSSPPIMESKGMSPHLMASFRA